MFKNLCICCGKNLVKFVEIGFLLYNNLLLLLNSICFKIFVQMQVRIGCNQLLCAHRVVLGLNVSLLYHRPVRNGNGHLEIEGILCLLLCQRVSGKGKDLL